MSETTFNRLFKSGILILAAIFVYVFANSPQNNRYQMNLGQGGMTVTDTQTGDVYAYRANNDKQEWVEFAHIKFKAKNLTPVSVKE